MRIAVDIDEVLCPFLESFVVFANKAFKTRYTLEDFKTYNLEEVIDRPIQEVIDVVRAFYREELEFVPSFSDALPVLKKLKENHELILVTARHHEAIEKTPLWIEKHFPDIFKEIIFSSNPAIEQKLSKAMICKQQKIDVLIEDDPRHINICIEENITVIMPKRNWNESVQNNGVIGVENWQEIESRIDELSTHSSKR